MPSARVSHSARIAARVLPISLSCGQIGIPGYGVKILGEKLTFGYSPGNIAHDPKRFLAMSFGLTGIAEDDVEDDVNPAR